MNFPSEILTKGEHTIHGVVAGSEGYVLSQLVAQTGKDVLYIASSDQAVAQIKECLSFFSPETQTIMLPSWDCLPYDRSSPNAAILASRIVALSRIASKATKPRIILANVNTVIQKLPPRALLAASSYPIKVGNQIHHDALSHFLVEHGYRRVGKAMESGEFAVRGSIIDIIPAGMQEGIRLDTFGSTLETIKLFEPISQISKETLPEVMLYPASEVILNKKTIACFREQYRRHFGAATKEDAMYESISEGRSSAGMEHLLPLFYESLETLFDYCPNAVLALDCRIPASLMERLELIGEYYESRCTSNTTKRSSLHTLPYSALPPALLYLDETQWKQRVLQHPTLHFSLFNASGATQFDLHYRPARNFVGSRLTGGALFTDLRQYVNTERANGKSALIACYSQGSRERIATMLHEHDFHPLRIESFAEIKKISGKTVGLVAVALENGFVSEHFALISEQDLLGERIIRSTKTKKKSDNFLSEAANFIPGELVVHKEHGIGRFEGLLTLEVLGALHDCLKIIYDGEAKLFLPVENIELVSRYGTEEEGAKLDRLGSASWQARKAKLKERIHQIAEELLKTAAGRELATAPHFEAEAGLYDEFCARFPYTETDDQLRAIEEILTDLNSGRPTDRLICGDVGFGKTEVALRAAFVAASNASAKGKVQVAVICPTTLLSRQHYHTFTSRFEGMPFTIRQLSRLTTAKENKATLEGLANGEVDIVIGTHALLGKNLAFKNLGLLIIDEEQHFGVTQKEKLKSLKSDIHVITLSATPIPRTLQLALSGVRELSIIATPPVDRLAVRTFVTPFDAVVLREAIMREYNRGGKIFYVTPRIKYMSDLQAALKEIVPEIRIATAHGQMSPSELDDIMNRFYDGAYDMLLATTIVESGLDIPTANTIIIDHAEMLGLSQLYQLRGRVGRGKIRAYAYFTLPHKKQLTRSATRRLEVMQTLDSLGAGFNLASHDMDIRGFGNLLGDEQSGHVREVGIELYQQMLEDAVKQAKDTQKGIVTTASDDEWSPQINLGMTVLIPESYVEDLELRLGLYRRAASLSSEAELDSFAAEMIDRFGKLPEEVVHFLEVMRIKRICRKVGIERIDVGPKGVVLTFRKNQFSNPDGLIQYVTKHSKIAKIRPDHKLFLMQEYSDNAAKLKGVQGIIGELERLL